MKQLVLYCPKIAVSNKIRSANLLVTTPKDDIMT